MRALTTKAALMVLALALGEGCSIVAGSNAGIPVLERAPSPVAETAVGAKYAGWVASAPVVLATAPLAALAWATPWVDLALAADIATAPGVALGWAFEAALGFPLYACAFWLDDEDGEGDASGPWKPGEPSCVPWGFVVSHDEARGEARPSEPLPAEAAAYYAVSPEEIARLERALDDAARSREDDGPLSVKLEGIDANLELSLAPGEGARPLVLMTPPSDGTFAARWLAARYARRGIHAAVIVPADVPYLDPALDAAGIEAKLRASVVETRAVVAALSRRADVKDGKVEFLGISAGGIFGAILLAVEPGIDRAALVFPGGDFPALVATSEEGTVRRYREAWAARGVSPEALCASFARAVRTDPLLLARHVERGRVLVFLSDGDTSVPVAGGAALRDALGGPETWVLAGDHETASLSFGWILRTADEHLLGE